MTISSADQRKGMCNILYADQIRIRLCWVNFRNLLPIPNIMCSIPVKTFHVIENWDSTNN